MQIPHFAGCARVKRPVSIRKAYTYMEIGILIPIILIILILLFSGSRQKSTFRQTETRLQDALLEKIKEVELLQSRQRPSAREPKPPEPTYRTPPPEISYDNDYWKALSKWYREEQDWICERCGIHLKSRKQFLHTHHMRGRAYNSPENIKALCVRCHSDQTQPVDHSFMKNTPEYRHFMKYRG